MLQKYLLAFALGGALVGGVVYLTRRPATAPVQPPAMATVAQPAASPLIQAPVPAVQEPEKQPPSLAPEPSAQPRSARRLAKQAQPTPDVQMPDPPAESAQADPQPQGEEHASASPPPPVMPRQEAQKSLILRPEKVAVISNRTPQTVTIPSGTQLAVRLRQLISTDRQAVGDPFAATLDEPIVIDGFVIADKGSNVSGKITSLDAAGKVKGRAAISLELTELNTTDGQRVEIHTDTYRNEAASGKKGDMAKIGAGAALGAIIGAIAGGGKGAAIGAGVGGAAGGGVVVATKGEDVRLTSETKLTFRLTEKVMLTEKLN